MIENKNIPKTLDQVIKSRRSIRNFSDEVPGIEEIEEILKSALYADWKAINRTCFTK